VIVTTITKTNLYNNSYYCIVVSAAFTKYKSWSKCSVIKIRGRFSAMQGAFVKFGT